MSISFPRALPSLLASGCEFDLDRRDVAIPEASGRLVGVVRGDALWKMTFSVTTTRDDFDLWRAWGSSLRGVVNMFYGQDVFRRMPRWYRNGFADLSRSGGGSFDGSASSWSVNDARDALTLNGLPAALRLSYGDYIGMVWSTTKRSLHRVLTDGVADIGGVGTWSIEPPVPAWLSAATATINAPDCTMKILPDTWKAPNDHPQRRVSFEALQHLEQ